MRAVVIGNGSIGKRRAGILRDMGVYITITDIGEPLQFNHDFAVICTPTETHADFAYEYLYHKIPFFLEKPSAMSISDVEYIRRHKWYVPNMVACNLRFTNTAIKVKEMESPIISIHSRISDGGAYRDKYNEHLALQDIHEFDLLRWLLGEYTIDMFRNSNTSYDALLNHGASFSSIHGDRISKEYHRSLTVTTEEKTTHIPFDFYGMYEREMAYFLDCVENNKTPMNSIEEATDVAERIILACDRNSYPSETDKFKIA